MVKIPSLSGKEGQLAKFIKEFMKKADFDEVLIDKYGNTIGQCKGKKPGKKILFDGHIDTVDVEREKWNHDPYAAEVVDNKIYGRGTSDMKGALAAMIMAIINYSCDKNKNFSGDIYISCTVLEEVFEGVAARNVSEWVDPDYVIIGEASNLKLMHGQRGRAEIILETNGKRAHSANPHIGKNAVYDMVEVIKAIKEAKKPVHKILGEGIMELTDIISTPYPGVSVIPDKCRTTYDRRLLIGETKQSVISKINNDSNKTVPKFEVYYNKGKAEFWTGNKIKTEKYFPAWLYDKGSFFNQKCLSGFRNVGLNSDFSHYSFCTNGSHFAGEKGIPTIGFGPSREELAHIDDEYIEIEQLYKAYKGYYGILKSIMT